jgi:hypothetical protein
MNHNPQVFHAPDEGLSQTARRKFGKYYKRTPLPNEATARSINIWSLPEYVSPPTTHYRAGSQDALAIKSKGR